MGVVVNWCKWFGGGWFFVCCCSCFGCVWGWWICGVIVFWICIECVIVVGFVCCYYGCLLLVWNWSYFDVVGVGLFVGCVCFGS